jgi:hypothetical protein
MHAYINVKTLKDFLSDENEEKILNSGEPDSGVNQQLFRRAA